MTHPGHAIVVKNMFHDHELSLLATKSDGMFLSSCMLLIVFLKNDLFIGPWRSKYIHAHLMLHSTKQI